MKDTATDIFDDDAMEQLRRLLRLDPQIVRAFRNRLLKKFESDSETAALFPDTAELRLHSLDLFQRHDSKIDGATKLLFRTEAALLIESVILRIATGRTTVCISSQVGCAAACVFCATGKMGIAKNLSVAEILDQVLQSGQLLTGEQRRIQNVVFMGMGEPFHNEANVTAAVAALTSPKMFDRSPKNILVSTVGIPDAMIRFAERFPNANLALSLHSAEQETRTKLIPLAAKHTLGELKRALIEVNRLKTQPVMIEYLMLSGVNDSAENADLLIDWLRGIRSRVNLIPYNSIDDAPHLRCSTKEAIDRFAERLKAAGIETTIRYSLGSDIAAACGQLVRSESRNVHADQNRGLHRLG